jgi:hypothetical protein
MSGSSGAVMQEGLTPSEVSRQQAGDSTVNVAQRNLRHRDQVWSPLFQPRNAE